MKKRADVAILIRKADFTTTVIKRYEEEHHLMMKASIQYEERTGVNACALWLFTIVNRCKGRHTLKYSTVRDFHTSSSSTHRKRNNRASLHAGPDGPKWYLRNILSQSCRSTVHVPCSERDHMLCRTESSPIQVQNKQILKSYHVSSLTTMERNWKKLYKLSKDTGNSNPHIG